MWQSNPAKKALARLTEILGEPDWISEQEGGECVWTEKTISEKGLFFSEIRIVDENLLHESLQNTHCDYLYVSVRTKINKKYLKDVLSVSPSIRYDDLKEELTARCFNIGACVVILLLALILIYNFHDQLEMSYLEQYYINKSQNKEGFIENYQKLYIHLKNNLIYFPINGNFYKNCYVNSYEKMYDVKDIEYMFEN